MRFYAQINSPLGTILLSSNGTQLDGLYFMGQKDCPAVDSLPPAKPRNTDPTAGMLAGAAIKDFKAYKKTTAPTLFDEDDLRPTGLAVYGNTAGATASGLSAGRTTSGYARGDPMVVMQANTPQTAVDLFEQTRNELDEYFEGKRKVFTMPLYLDGTDFQKKVWQALLDIPYGEYVSYGDVALAAGLTTGHGRPVGTAVGRNPLTIIVPCHRVLASTGRLNGYTGGLERKFALLELEGFTLG